VVRVWDAQTGTLVAGPFEGHASSVSSVHFSPDGTHIASGSYDHTVRVWDTQTGTLIAGPFGGHTDWVRSVNFSPDGTRIASGSDDNTVRIWDAQTGTLVAGPFEGHTNWVNSVHFSPDGAWIASGSGDHTVRVWDAQTGTLVAGPFEGHTDSVRSVHFSPDGTRIASGSADGTVRISRVRETNQIHHPSQLISSLDNFTFNSDSGWVRNAAGDRMFWVPPWLREGLYLPYNTLVIRSRGTTKLDLSRFVYGTEWTKCIDPNFTKTQ
jgi:WD40 repeat protein